MDLTNNNCSPVARCIAEAIPENLHVNDFAKYVAEVLNNEYGNHNKIPFLLTLINELDNDVV